MKYTIKTNYKIILNRLRQKFDKPEIILPNGAKCNPDFYWECVRLGILNPDED